jgi:dehydrogenase/reductase SDR family protein 1
MTNDRERNEAPMGNVALVTGASRGVGRGIAMGLLAAGFRVYGSGRSIDQADLPQEIRRVRCDHLNDDDTARVFEAIRSGCGTLDLSSSTAPGAATRRWSKAARSRGLRRSGINRRIAGPV